MEFLVYCILSIVIICFYSFLIIYFTYGWNRIPIFKPTHNVFHTFVSVIVPVRNEGKNIAELLTCLARQDYPFDKFEIIVMDDHSEDNTVSKINGCSGGNIRLYQLGKDKVGKKQAIYHGVQKARGSLIVTTDADCTMDTKWLISIVAFYEKYHPNMIVAPVVFEESRSLFGKMQSLEFLSLIGSGAGAIGNNKPIMCNGANLAYEKEELLYNFSLLKNKVSSGDDVLFMLNLKKNRKKIMFLKSSEAIVRTKPIEGLNNFIQQRKRWVSKSKLYRDRDVIVTSLIVFFINLLLLGILIGSFINNQLIYLLCVVLIIKTIVDFPILYAVTGFFKRRKLLFYFIPVQIFYFVYVSFIPIVGMIGRYGWKGRTSK